MINRLRIIILLLLATLNLTGCTYMTNRYNDFKDVMDVGVTFSSKPQFSAYASGPFVQVGTLGWGHVDGHFFGMGEGRLALWAPHYEDSWGLFVVGQEYVSFYHTEAELMAMPEKERNEAANYMQVGIVGMPMGLAGYGPPPPTLKYFGSCPHYLHLGWIGIVGGPRWLQMGDFILGWTTLDICGDDNRDLDGVPLKKEAGSGEPAAGSVK